MVRLTMGIAEARPDALTVNKRIGQICVVGLLVATAGLVSCRHRVNELETRVVDTLIVCQNFKPITWVESDSVRTRAQVNAHNAVWDAYCSGSLKKEDE